MKFENRVYVIFDKKSKEAIDCFTVMNSEVAMRFMNIRIANALEQKNSGLLTVWRDCVLFEYDMSGEAVVCKELIDIEKLLPRESNENEKN